MNEMAHLRHFEICVILKFTTVFSSLHTESWQNLWSKKTLGIVGNFKKNYDWVKQQEKAELGLLNKSNTVISIKNETNPTLAASIFVNTPVESTT